MVPASPHDAPAYHGDIVVIRPRKYWFEIDAPLLWQFRDLLFALTWRDIRLRYRQTFLGISWVILQPLLAAAVFSIVFGLIAKMPSGGVPYFVISYSGMLGWTLYSTTLTRVGACLVANAELIRKIFFPRLLLPLGIVPCTLLDLVCGLALMVVLMIIYGIVPSWRLVFFPLSALVLIILALGPGMIAGSLAVRYRDIQYIIPLLVQMLMFASPVGYSASVVPSYLKPFYNLNPLVSPIEIMRWSLIGVGHLDLYNFIYSAIFSLILLVIGLATFKHLEPKFADVI